MKGYKERRWKITTKLFAKTGTLEEHPWKMGIIYINFEGKVLRALNKHLFYPYFSKYLCYLPTVKLEDTEKLMQTYHSFSKEAAEY